MRSQQGCPAGRVGPPVWSRALCAGPWTEVGRRVSVVLGDLVDMMSIRILGPVEVWAQQRRLDSGGRRQLALFAFLVLHANRAVSRDALIDAVWGSERSSSDNRLSMAIARLRKALEALNLGGESPLRTVSGGYMLAVDPGELDCEALADGVSAGRRVLEAGDPGGASELVGQALALWRGPPLAEVAFEDFAQPEIRRLEELRLEAVEVRVDADLELGRHAQLVGELEGLLAEHPARERVASQLMLTLYRCGRQGDALEVYQRARAHLATELGLEPGPALKALQTQILEQALSLTLGVDRAGAVVSSTRSRAAPVPLPATPTIGRALEVEDVCGLLAETDTRLVTLTGPGGVGKTRLALAAAHAAAAAFVDGAAWVELAGVTRPDDVAPTIVRALALTPVPGETPRDALSRYLSGKRLLLVIDNFEHVIDAAELVGELVSAGDRLKVLVTSREALNLSAEHRVVVGPLALPAISDQVSVADVQSAAATALFVDAARRRSHFAMTEAQAPSVARICARLDGLPLALELAAARTDVLGIDELATRLASITDLGTGPRDAPARQRTLSATIDWSYRLLDQDQQRAFARFAVFAGGATLESAQEVTGAAGSTLAALIAKNLLSRRVAPDGTTRLVLLETIREYALQRIAEDSEQHAVCRRHLRTYLQLVQRYTPQLSTHTESEALATIEREIDNIRAALDWALEQAPTIALRLVGLLGQYFWIRSNSDALPAVDAAIRAAGEQAPVRDRALAQLARAYQLNLRQQIKAALTAATAALGLYESVDDQRGMSEACYWVAALSGWVGNEESERRFAERACEHARLAGDEALLGNALARRVRSRPAAERPAALEELTALLTRSGNYRQVQVAHNNCGDMAIKEGRIDEALNLFEVAEAAAAKASTPWLTMRLVSNIAVAHLFDGNHTAARERFAQVLELRAIQGFDSTQGWCLAGLAVLAALDDQLERAALLLGAAQATGYGVPDDVVLEEQIERDYFGPARARLGETVWARAEHSGRNLPDEQVVVHARETAGLAEGANADTATSSDALAEPHRKAQTDRAAQPTKLHPRPRRQHDRSPPPPR